MTAQLRPLAQVLRSLRAEQEVDQLGLALALGASDGSYLSKLENGRAGNPSVTFLSRYVGAYGLLGRALTAEQTARLMRAAIASACERATGAAAVDPVPARTAMTKRSHGVVAGDDIVLRYLRRDSAALGTHDRKRVANAGETLALVRPDRVEPEGVGTRAQFRGSAEAKLSDER